MAKRKKGEMTKADAVRRALDSGVDQPQEASAYIKEKFDIEISPQMFSTYKSQLKIRSEKKAAGSGRGRRGIIGADNAAINLDLARKLKALVDEYGADSVQKVAAVAAVFAK